MWSKTTKDRREVLVWLGSAAAAGAWTASGEVAAA